MIYETNYIMHYNKNHDKLGRFAKSGHSTLSYHGNRINAKKNKYLEANKTITNKQGVRLLNKIEKYKTNELFRLDRKNKKIEKTIKKNKEEKKKVLLGEKKITEKNIKEMSKLGKEIIDKMEGPIYSKDGSQRDLTGETIMKKTLRSAAMSGAILAGTNIISGSLMGIGVTAIPQYTYIPQVNPATGIVDGMYAPIPVVNGHQFIYHPVASAASKLASSGGKMAAIGAGLGSYIEGRSKPRKYYSVKNKKKYKKVK